MLLPPNPAGSSRHRCNLPQFRGQTYRLPDGAGSRFQPLSDGFIAPVDT
jgi:hypothetical protein